MSKVTSAQLVLTETGWQVCVVLDRKDKYEVASGKHGKYMPHVPYHLTQKMATLIGKEGAMTADNDFRPDGWIQQIRLTRFESMEVN